MFKRKSRSKKTRSKKSSVKERAETVKKAWERVRLAPGPLGDFAYSMSIKLDSIEVIDPGRGDLGLDYYEVLSGLEKSTQNNHWEQNVEFAEYLIEKGVEYIVGSRTVSKNIFSGSEFKAGQAHYGLAVKIGKK